MCKGGEIGHMLLQNEKAFLEEMDNMAEKRKMEIRRAEDHIEVKGQAYYVSN